ncbi:MAG: RNA polymerase sigma factor [Actinobacteria bacterium]|nr:RNA polymerase sigma factor [Actinomycetota bacterium]
MLEQEGTGFTGTARAHLPRLYSLARRLVGQHADDLVQECLLRAYRAWSGLRDPVASEAWFTAILVNCAKDRYRYVERHAREVPIDPVDGFSLYRTLAAEDPFPYSDSLHLDFLCRFGPEDVWQVLDDLPELYRVPLVLVHMEGWPAREVADALDVAVGTVHARLHRGRKLFERTLWTYAVGNDLLRTGAPA